MIIFSPRLILYPNVTVLYTLPCTVGESQNSGSLSTVVSFHFFLLGNWRRPGEGADFRLLRCHVPPEIEHLVPCTLPVSEKWSELELARATLGTRLKKKKKRKEKGKKIIRTQNSAGSSLISYVSIIPY